MADNATNIMEFRLASLFFNATSWAEIAMNDDSSPLASFSIQLHTASPTDTGDLTASETNYGGYARVGVERTSSGFTVSGSSSATAVVNFTTPVVFPPCTSGTATITHFSIGNSTVAASTGIMYIYGTVTPNISVATGVTPRLTTATQITIT